MIQTINEVKKQILEKNIALRGLKREQRLSKDKIRQVEIDLDNLLYTYIKLLRRNNNVV